MKKALLAGEPKLAKSIDVCHGIRILNQDYWEVLISFIVSQNNNIPRIKKMHRVISQELWHRDR